MNDTKCIYCNKEIEQHEGRYTCIACSNSICKECYKSKRVIEHMCIGDKKEKEYAI